MLAKISAALLVILCYFILFASLALAQKRVEVSLTKQQLYAYDGDKLIQSFAISSGKFAPTPTGTFYPWAKVASQRMIGGDKRLGTYYDLPNVPYVVYFYQGYALHGTYWHNNFGTPMSHGCVNAPTNQMSSLYNWIDYSTPIHIY